MPITSKSPLEELFEQFPRGLALIELVDPADTATWRLLEINALASSLVPPSIETFLSGELLGVGKLVDLPAAYRYIVQTRHSRTLGTVEPIGRTRPHEIARGASGSRASGIWVDAQGVGATRMYSLSAFSAGARCVGILFEDMQSSLAARSARLQAERLLSQTCDFLGAILWRAEPATLQFTYVSYQAQSILGYWLERWTGETNFWKKHLFPDDRERVNLACQKIVRERKRQDFEFRMIDVQSRIVWFHAAAELIQTQGRPPELAGVMNDITALKDAEGRIRRLSSRLMRTQDDERRRISRELHDSLGQYLTSMKINFDILKRQSGSLSEPHRELLTESAQTLEKCVQEVRSVSYLLHPPLLDELGLLAALRWYVGAFTARTGIAVNLEIPERFSRLPDEMELGLFRIVQESLTNVQRHSHSDVASITLSERKNRAELTIADRGVGVPPEIVGSIREGKSIEGVGLRGMYERVRELGGQLEIVSGSSGTVLSAVLPLQRTTATGDADEVKARVAGKPINRTASADVYIEAVPDHAASDAADQRPSARRTPPVRKWQPGRD